jgi:hypothetical protein
MDATMKMKSKTKHCPHGVVKILWYGAEIDPDTGRWYGRYQVDTFVPNMPEPAHPIHRTPDDFATELDAIDAAERLGLPDLQC